MDKHAYLIIAHNNFSVLKKLLELIDDYRNDIYIHLDKKVKKFDFTYFKNLCKKSDLHFLKRRYNIKWGESSQVKAEMLLFKSSLKGHYKYYHLISGVDLPLKTQDFIHDYFSDKDLIFLYYKKDYTLFDYQRISLFRFSHSVPEKIKNILMTLQIRLKIDRIKKYNYHFARGRNWCSLPYDAVEYLVQKRRFIKHICRFSSCADEVYKQFLLYNSPLKDKIFKDENGQTNDLREIDWIRRVNDSPHVFTIEDKEMLFNSKKLFARKFDEKVDKEIIDEVFEFVKSKANI